ncbi:hypothetical protein XENOCAPTIV_023924 [Xenoophorus captivus]|uniref:Uncharacterized protein n=1 Tax=Xenoophorus captivus TaxID=1517983 RepID=A0ABV0SAF6_9TELE
MGSVPGQTLSCKILQGNKPCDKYTVLSHIGTEQKSVISNQNQPMGWFWLEIRAETSRHSRTCSLIVLAHIFFTFSKYQDKKNTPITKKYESKSNPGVEMNKYYITFIK